MSNARRLTISAVMLLGLSLSSIASAAIIVSHSGSTNPTTEGWTAFESPVGSAVISGGTPAWNVTDNSSARAYYAIAGATLMNNLFTPEQQTLFNENGWTASWNVEVVSGSQFNAPRIVETSFGVNNGLGNRRYTLFFGRKGPSGAINATGPDLELQLSDGNDGDGFAFVGTFVGEGAGFHRFDLIGAPGTNDAALYKDGVFLTTYIGFANNTGMFWGSIAESGQGSSNWNLVQFAVNEPIPEPAGLALLGGGLLAITRGRGRRSA